ncbi:MAG: ABC transporter ATP-binding protein, partial [Nitrospinae bacterium]|nr:ABC transporter ATP-binding protein [Nitrospinota bacterium]
MMRAEDLRKIYQMDGAKVDALAGVTFQIPPGSYTALMGKSGSGKSTLMNLLGLLDTPTSGRYWLNGRDVSSLSEDELSVIRNREIGFVFQSHNLLARNTAVENVCLPLYYRGITRPQQQAAAA